MSRFFRRSGKPRHPEVSTEPQRKEYDGKGCGRFVLVGYLIFAILAGIAGSDKEKDLSLPPGVPPDNASWLGTDEEGRQNDLPKPYAFNPRKVWGYFRSLSPEDAEQYLKAALTGVNGDISDSRLRELVWYVRLGVINESEGVASYQIGRLDSALRSIEGVNTERVNEAFSDPIPPAWILFHLAHGEDTDWMMDLYPDKYGGAVPKLVEEDQVNVQQITGVWWEDTGRFRKASQYQADGDIFKLFSSGTEQGFISVSEGTWQLMGTRDAIEFMELWASLTPEGARAMSDTAEEYKESARIAVLFWFYNVLNNLRYQGYDGIGVQATKEFSLLSPHQKQLLLSLLSKEDWEAIRWLAFIRLGKDSGVATDVLMGQLFTGMGVDADQLPESYHDAKQQPFAWHALWILDLKLAQVVDVKQPYGDKDLEADSSRGYEGYYLGATAKLWDWLSDETADLVEREKRWRIFLSALSGQIDDQLREELPPYVHDILLVWRDLDRGEQEALVRLLGYAKTDQVGATEYLQRSLEDRQTKVPTTASDTTAQRTAWDLLVPDGNGGLRPVPPPLGVDGPTFNGVKVGGPFTPFIIQGDEKRNSEGT